MPAWRRPGWLRCQGPAPSSNEPPRGLTLKLAFTTEAHKKDDGEGRSETGGSVLNPEPVEPRSWSRPRWWSMLAIVLCGQLGLIFWLGARGPVTAARAARVPTLRLAGPAFDELVGLTDPTLFALPHQEGFAGPAWLTVHKIAAEPFVWSEPSRWLMLQVEELGATFRTYIATNEFNPPQALSGLTPESAFATQAASLDLPQQSVLHLTGDLAALPLVSALRLTSWTNSEILTNSVVQVLVGTDGRPVSVTLLAGSGSKEADQAALQQALRARFQPGKRAPGPAAGAKRGLAWGQMIFEWHTLPPLPANRVENPQ